MNDRAHCLQIIDPGASFVYKIQIMVAKTARIQPVPLRKQVRDLIAQQLWRGDFSFGDDLNEARLAEELGVSRTPLREGLVMLASEGLIEARPNRGFHVPAADPNAVAELYPILAALEGLALQTSTGDLRRLAADLDKINALLRKPKLSHLRRNAADVDWHERLIANCPNATLRQEISVLRARSRSIDGTLLRGLANTEGSFAEHQAISALIAEGNLAKAAAMVDDHWHHGIDVVTAWIEEFLQGSSAR